MFTIKQHDNVSGSGRKTRADKDLANATAYLDMPTLFVIEFVSAQSFNFKVTPRPPAAPQARNRQNTFHFIKSVQILFTFLPPRLDHEKNSERDRDRYRKRNREGEREREREIKRERGREREVPHPSCSRERGQESGVLALPTIGIS
jgi:hypothetical protein